MEGYSIYIGKASTLHCRKATIILAYKYNNVYQVYIY